MSTTKKNSSKSAQQPTLPTASTGESTRVEIVTPELAAEWLKKNTRNRHLIVRVAEDIAADITAGRWRVTHQGIAFGVDGTLFDGQHRLHAIVIAGRAVSVRVTRGLPAEARDAIDTGTARRAHDVYAITDGVVIGTNVRSAICACSTMVKSGSVMQQGRIRAANLKAAAEEHLSDVTAVWSAFGRDTTRIAKTGLIAALAIAYRTDPEKVGEFAALVRSGENMHGDHPAMQIRNFVLVRYVSRGSASMDDLALRTFAAFESFVAGRPLKLLKCSEVARAKYLAPWRSEAADAA